MATAYVLVNTELGHEAEVVKELKMIEGVLETYLVYGVYDIIGRIEAETMEELKNIISWKVRRIQRVRSTLTMVVM
jgi:DNA-binding Lrp family transcriptional regulator